MLTVIRLEDFLGKPTVKLDAPGPLRIGDPLCLPAFMLERTSSEGRRETLSVPSRLFRITAVGVDASTLPHRQILSVECAQGSPNSWQAVKKTSRASRRLSPARAPKTSV